MFLLSHCCCELFNAYARRLLCADPPSQQRHKMMSRCRPIGTRVTAVGFEPTPLRTGALSQRLRPLGQTVVRAAQDTTLTLVLHACWFGKLPAAHQHIAPRTQCCFSFVHAFAVPCLRSLTLLLQCDCSGECSLLLSMLLPPLP